MHRTPIAVALVAVLTACGTADDGPPATPQARVLVAGDGGAAYMPAVSPDSTRLAWSQVVQGRSAIFSGNLDGSQAVRLTHGIWDQFPVWSPSGDWIAYHGEAPDYDLFIVPSTGGEARQLTSGPPVDFPWYWLPDDSGVVFTREGEGAEQTLVAPLDGGPVRTLVPAGPGNRFVALSPDGSKAAVNVVSGDGESILLFDVATGESTPLTTEGMESMSLHPWSPDGRFLLFESRRTGTRDIWIAAVETGELRQITTDIHQDDEARWSPDGRWVAFRSTRGGQPDLWLVAAEGGTPRRVTDTPAIEDNVLWMRDGSGLLFTRISTTDRLQVQALNGEPPRVLLEWPEARIAEGDVSRAASSVVFSSPRSGNMDIWTIPLGGGEPMALTTGIGADEAPRFSPDGGSIAFHSHMGGTGDVWIVPAGGGQARQLTNWPSNETDPRWSPDGSMIAFVSDRDADRLDAWVVAASGGEPRRLSTGLGDVRGLEWSPDGSTIYFVGGAGRSSDLYRVSVDGGEPERFNVDPSIGFGDLSPDGMHYAYSVFSGGWAYIEVVPTAGGAARRLTSQTEGVFNNFVLWAADGASLIVFDYQYEDDSYDLQVVTWPDGDWRRLTGTPGVSEFPFAVTDDSHLLVNARTEISEIVSVPVVELIGGVSSR